MKIIQQTLGIASLFKLTHIFPSFFGWNYPENFVKEEGNDKNSLHFTKEREKLSDLIH